MTLQPPNSSNNNIICSQCFKQFPSQKSLFGHMRCHPDRNWRGIHPPHLNPPITSHQQNHSTDLPANDDRDHDTALFLLMLAHSDHKAFEDRFSTKRKRKSRTRDSSNTQPLETHLGPTTNLPMRSAACVGVHKCSICDRVFPTGQALGGHKRCHWARGERLNRVQGLPVFDLNEPAPISEEDVEAAYGMVDVVPSCVKSLKFLGRPFYGLD
ncbi:zinc finger protein ZAT2-like [Magnolia sinica]|uniref:zinc finger protein ZAT2-like n=1 Tax=Magnolia sinica TaxID=86752 RepID=UPI00265A6835|nr:zinc finger protein ZAT2-like [Magnolia sinica]